MIKASSLLEGKGNIMSIIVRKSKDRGHLNHGWLDTYHTFSFGEYHDSRHMGFRSLRVINEDKVHGGYGFDTHPHKNMEIITYVISGSLSHKDSMGNIAAITPGNVQIMSAGSGLMHSESNQGEETVHLLQIWILPNKLNIKPRHEDIPMDKSDKLNKFCLIASPSEDTFTIHQDAKIYCSILEKGKELKYDVAKGRGLWIQLIRGKLKINDIEIESGDGASIEAISHVNLDALSECEFLLFDLQ